MDFKGVPHEVQQLLRASRTTGDASENCLQKILEEGRRAAFIDREIEELGCLGETLAHKEISKWHKLQSLIQKPLRRTTNMDEATEKKLRRIMAKVEHLPQPDGMLAELLGAHTMRASMIWKVCERR